MFKQRVERERERERERENNHHLSCVDWLIIFNFGIITKIRIRGLRPARDGYKFKKQNKKKHWPRPIFGLSQLKS